MEVLFGAARLGVHVRLKGEATWRVNDAVFLDWYEAYRYSIRLAQRQAEVEDVRVVPELGQEVARGSVSDKRIHGFE